MTLSVEELELVKCLDTVDEYPSQFLTTFRSYLLKNFHLWAGFQKKSFDMISTGRTSYGAKTIIQVLRWDTDLADSDHNYKITDKYAADFGRLFMLLYSEHQGFFKTKESPLRARPPWAEEEEEGAPA